METLIILGIVVFIVYRFSGYKKKEPIRAKQLATVLMAYTIGGQLDNVDPESLAMGPRLWTDPKDDSYAFKKEMEICFLRGFAFWHFSMYSLKSKEVRDALFEHYDEFWKSYSSIGLDFLYYWNGTKQIYGWADIIIDLEKGINPYSNKAKWEEKLPIFVAEVANNFASMCDYENRMSDDELEKLKEEGQVIFSEALETSYNWLHVLQTNHKITV